MIGLAFQLIHQRLAVGDVKDGHAVAVQVVATVGSVLMVYEGALGVICTAVILLSILLSGGAIDRLLCEEKHQGCRIVLKRRG